MKILHIQHVKGIAGSEKYIFHLCQAQKALGYDPHFLCAYKPTVREKLQPFLAWFEQANIPYYPLEIGNDLSWKTLWAIRQVCKQESFNLIHSHLIHADLWMTLCKQLFSVKTPIVSTKHGYEESYIQQHGLSPLKKAAKGKYYYLAKWAERGISKSICVSHGIAQLYEGLDIIKSGASQVVHHGLNIEIEDTPDRPHRLAPQQIAIVGRLVRFKGHTYVFDALKELTLQFPDLKLILVGSGEDREDLQREVVRKGIQAHVEFLGFQADPIHYMAHSDIVCLPSIAEPFGLVFLEAFKAQTPVVAFNVPAGNEIIDHGENGMLVKAFDTRQLADTLRALLQDPLERRRLAQNAYSKLHTYFTLERMTAETMAVCEQVLVQ